MGPASENAGYAVIVDGVLLVINASMGPASENAGYAPKNLAIIATAVMLQWVQRPRTPVMPRCPSWLFRNDLGMPLREVASLLHPFVQN